jgi:hypothetical protein
MASLALRRNCAVRRQRPPKPIVAWMPSKAGVAATMATIPISALHAIAAQWSL